VALASNGEAVPSVATALSPQPDVFLSVFPRTGKIGQTRRVFLRYFNETCVNYSFTLDTSQLDSGRVVLRTNKVITPCPLVPPGAGAFVRRDFEFTPTKAGPIDVSWDLVGVPVTVQTQATLPASRFAVDGMWFDPATNGSGISIHHQKLGSDAAFGTWFLFNNNGETRWYSLQQANWLQDGSVLEGLLVDVAGTCAQSNTGICPARGSVPGLATGNVFTTAPAIARITFQSATRARADVTRLDGAPIFVSNMQKLEP
jgi:hypothetical protein